MEILYFKDKNVYIFDGYNLKYKELEGYYVPVVNKETGEILDKVKPNYVTLSISEVYKNDIKKIHDFFNKNQFNEEIDIKDLDGLDVEIASKEYLVDLFNRAISSELKTAPGNYYNNSFISTVNVKSTDSEIPGKWQISYLLDYGFIYDVNIEFIDSNGNYLSDIAQSKNISNIEATMFNTIQKIESDIVQQQKIKINLTKEKTAINSDLNKLLANLSEELKEDE